MKASFLLYFFLSFYQFFNEYPLKILSKYPKIADLKKVIFHQTHFCSLQTAPEFILPTQYFKSLNKYEKGILVGFYHVL